MPLADTITNLEAYLGPWRKADGSALTAQEQTDLDAGLAVIVVLNSAQRNYLARTLMTG